MDRLVNVNDVIEMLNNINRYVSGSLMLESNNKIFPSNEVFIVDDVYEGLETIPSLNGWIPCSKKMPEERVAVLISWNDDVFIAWRDEEEKCWDVLSRFSLYDTEEDEQVEFWMPLPEPCKKRGDKM